VGFCCDFYDSPQNSGFFITSQGWGGFFLFGLFFFRQNYLFACFFGVKPAPASEPAPKHDERVMPQDEPDSLYLLCA
jgi:hypothetical protein